MSAGYTWYVNSAGQTIGNPSAIGPGQMMGGVLYNYPSPQIRPQEISYTNWPAFNRENTCPKCGHAEVAFEWHRGYYYHYTQEPYVAPPANNVTLPCRFQEEHMHRTCKACKADWPELPLDAVAQIMKEKCGIAEGDDHEKHLAMQQLGSLSALQQQRYLMGHYNGGC